MPLFWNVPTASLQLSACTQADGIDQFQIQKLKFPNLLKNITILNKIIEKINSIILLGYFFGALYGAADDTKVVITEFFIIPYIDSAGVPDDISQYIELYNRSDEEIDVSNWSIETYDGDGNAIATCEFVPILGSITINPTSYFLISYLNNQFNY